MEANELRVGNIVQHKWFGDYEIHPDSFNGCHDYTPIRITDARLLKFGFVKANKVLDYQFYELSDWVYMFEGTYLKTISEKLQGAAPYEPSMFIIYGEMKGHNRFPLKVQYIHQLQNLHFAITGEELTTSDSLV